MSTDPLESLERSLYEAGAAFPYPPTPDISGKVARRLAAPQPRSHRRLAWAAAILILLIGSLFAVPAVRAQILDFLQVGVVRIFLRPTSSPSPAPPTPSQPGPTPSPVPTPTTLPSLLDLAGKTSLAEARKQATFPLRLPAYPPGLGPPDYVFLQNMGGSMVVLVWTRADDPGQVWMSLSEFGPDAMVAKKMVPPAIQSTTVNGQPAYWTSGPYMLELQNGDYEMRRLVTGHVLIWEQGEITYRLESGLSLEEAVRIAESLR
jgi:hypothetical protein